MKKKKKLTRVDENDPCEFTEGFYSRYVANLVYLRNDGEWLYKGDSPFGDGEILIGKKLNWFCKATNQTGNEIDFLRKENPLLTDRGANAVVLEEVANIKDWNGVAVLDEQSFRKELNSFRKSIINDDEVDDSDKTAYLQHNFWFNKNGEFHYMELSRTNKPLCRYHWGYKSDAGFFFLISGVPRITEHPDARTIYFVQNPWQLIIMREFVEDSIYVKPDEISYTWNNYPRIIAGKEVVFCSSERPFYCTFDDIQLDRFSKNDKDTVIHRLKTPREY